MLSEYLQHFATFIQFTFEGLHAGLLKTCNVWANGKTSDTILLLLKSNGQIPVCSKRLHVAVNIWFLYCSAYLICLKHFFWFSIFLSGSSRVFEFCLNIGSYFSTVMQINALSIQLFWCPNSSKEIILHTLLLTPTRLCDFPVQLLS